MSRTPTCAKIQSSHFTYTPYTDTIGGSFGIERSTFDHLGGLKQIYGTTGAVGFIMISARTGLEAEFRLTSVRTSPEGEITTWILSPTFSSYNQPGGRHLQHVTVHVFNT